MPDRKNALRDCLTAYEGWEYLPELSAWMDDDMLKQVTLWHGKRFERDEEYFDLNDAERGPFIAAGDEGHPTSPAYVNRSQVSEAAWAQLITWRQLIDQSQGEAIAAQARAFGPASAQSAAGEAQP
jgi:hypothetical protein